MPDDAATVARREHVARLRDRCIGINRAIDTITRCGASLHAEGVLTGQAELDGAVRQLKAYVIQVEHFAQRIEQGNAD